MPQKTNQEESEVTQAKEQSYYSALVSAWINSSMEKDKQIITISSAGIGFTISVLAAIKDSLSIVEFVAGIIIMGIFCWTIFLGLKIFSYNSDYIDKILKAQAIKSAQEKLLAADEIKKLEALMKGADNIFNKSFKLAMLMLCLLGAILGITFLTGGKMNEQEQTENRPPNNGQNRAIESFQGLNQLSPENLNLPNSAKDSPIIVPQPTNSESVPKTRDQNNSTINKEEK